MPRKSLRLIVVLLRSLEDNRVNGKTGARIVFVQNKFDWQAVGVQGHQGLC